MLPDFKLHCKSIVGFLGVRDYIKLKSKRNKQKEKATHELGENICRNISSKELASKIHKELMLTRELFTIITIAKTLKQLRCPLNGEWIRWPYYPECIWSCLKGEWILKNYIYVYTHIPIYMKYSDMEKKILAFPTAWVDLEGILLSEISHTEKNKYCIISLYVESKINLILKNSDCAWQRQEQKMEELVGNEQKM